MDSTRRAYGLEMPETCGYVDQKWRGEPDAMDVWCSLPAGHEPDDEHYDESLDFAWAEGDL